MDHSDKMWARAQKIIHFMLHRGSKTSDLTNTMKLSNINPTDFAGEVRALAHTLTNLKSITEDIYAVHKHANNRHDHANPTDNSYDPSVRCRVTRCRHFEPSVNWAFFHLVTLNAISPISPIGIKLAQSAIKSTY